MKVQAFFDRIGYTGDRERTVANLQQLVRCHLEKVPFENLDFYNDPKEMSLRPEDLYDKVVNRRRGGVCFELNGLFNWLLNQIGYECYPVSVRITMVPGAPSAITHQGNVAVVDGKKYYCDVGFGGPGPKGLVCLDQEGIQMIDGEPFEVQHKGISSVILRKFEGQMTPILTFADIPSDNADFPFLFFFFSGNPKSRFVTSRIANLCCPDGHLALTDNEFTARHGDNVVRRTLETDEEIRQVLEEEFGLVL